MPVLPRRAWPHCGAAVLAVAGALALTFVLTPLEACPSPLFFAAVMVGAWRGGLGPGLLATALSALALDFFFLPPVYSLATGLTDGLRLVVFALVATLISALSGARCRLEASLREQDRRRRDFLAVVAHELRNFLSPVLSALPVMRASQDESEIARHGREIVERQVKNMARLVADLVDLARIDQGKVCLCRERVDLRTAVAHAADAVRSLAEGRGHRLDVIMPPDPLFLAIDPTRLEQILANLLINAATHTEPGGQITLTVERGPGEALVRVRDSGAGIPAERLAQLFDLFAQGEGEARGGLGIGLNLAQRLARLHGGKVTAASEGPGKGSEFVVYLPLAAMPSAGAEDPAPQEQFTGC